MPPREWYFREDLGVRNLRDGSIIYYDPEPNNGPVDHGYELSNANTGLFYNGIAEGNLETRPGGTFAEDGLVLEGYKFTSRVNLAGEGQVLRDCLWTPQGENTIALEIQPGAVGCEVEGITIRPPEGVSAYVGILNQGYQTIIRRPHVMRCENAFTAAGDEWQLIEPFFEQPSAASNPGGHRDLVEVYAGDGWVIERGRLVHDDGETSPLNFAPWGGGEIHGGRVTKCFVDGGIYHSIVDGQPVEGHTELEIVTGVQYDGNWLGGHTFPGYTRYWALHNPDEGREVVHSLADQASDPSAVLWVIDDRDGFEPNMWKDCYGLTPNRSDTVVMLNETT